MSENPQKPDTSTDDPVSVLERPTRRSFLTRVGAAGVAIGTGQLHSVALADTDSTAEETAAAANAPAIMKLYTLIRSVRTPISRAPTMLLPVAIVCKPKVVLFSTKAIAATTKRVHRKGVNAVKPCQDQRESVGPYRFSPKISLNGSCTGATIGWLL